MAQCRPVVPVLRLDQANLVESAGLPVFPGCRPEGLERSLVEQHRRVGVPHAVVHLCDAVEEHRFLNVVADWLEELEHLVKQIESQLVLAEFEVCETHGSPGKSSTSSVSNSAVETRRDRRGLECFGITAAGNERVAHIDERPSLAPAILEVSIDL